MIISYMLQWVGAADHAGWNPWSNSQERQPSNDPSGAFTHKTSPWVPKTRDWAGAGPDQQRESPFWAVR